MFLLFSFISFFKSFSDRLYGPPSPLFDGTGGLSPVAKRPGRDVNHSPPSRTEVINDWSYTSTPSTCLHGVDTKKLLLSSFDVNPNIVVQWLKLLLSKVPVIEFRSRNGLTSQYHACSFPGYDTGTEVSKKTRCLHFRGSSLYPEDGDCLRPPTQTERVPFTIKAKW